MPFQPAQPSPTSTLISRLLTQVVQNPLYGTPFEHYRAEWVDDTAFDERGRPNYLARSPGQDATGITFKANPENPLRGVFCPSPRKAMLDNRGMFFQSDFQLYVLEDLGTVYQIVENRPKLQDKFVINQQTCYAAQPAFPCVQGETVAAWKIDLVLQRYPVVN